MAMKTLKEIDDAEMAVRERARLYQQLTEERDTLVRAVDRLAPQIADVAGLEALEQIATLAAQIPETVTTRASRFVAGGFNVKEFIASTAANALKDLQIRHADLVSTMEKVKARQVVNQQRLREFDE
jgi:hypothetical protein